MEIKLKKADERTFSIELMSKEQVKTLSIPSDKTGEVLIEGSFGKVERIDFTEGIMLEIHGNRGTIRIDISKLEFESFIPSAAHAITIKQ